jgi:hypothetical protein
MIDESFGVFPRAARGEADQDPTETDPVIVDGTPEQVQQIDPDPTLHRSVCSTRCAFEPSGTTQQLTRRARRTVHIA